MPTSHNRMSYWRWALPRPSIKSRRADSTSARQAASLVRIVNHVSPSHSRSRSRSHATAAHPRAIWSFYINPLGIPPLPAQPAPALAASNSRRSMEGRLGITTDLKAGCWSRGDVRGVVSAPVVGSEGEVGRQKVCLSSPPPPIV